MPMLTFMADVLRDAGLPVREIPGWQTRGHGQMGAVLGVVAHHTAGAAVGDFPSEKVVVNGRTGLAGPLCNLGLTRSGTWVVVAAGQAWHAGTGSISWCPANSGNSRLIGVEAESVGTRDDWTPAQRANYPRGVAALLRHLNLPASRVIGHKEWAPGRKIDPAFWDMAAFRADTARWLATQQEDDMALSPAEAQMLRDIHHELTFRLPNRRGPDGEERVDGGFRNDTILGYAANADGYGYRADAALDQLLALVTELAARTQATPRPSPTGSGGVVALSDADVARIAAAVLTELSKRTAA